MPNNTDSAISTQSQSQLVNVLKMAFLLLSASTKFHFIFHDSGSIESHAMFLYIFLPFIFHRLIIRV